MTGVLKTCAEPGCARQSGHDGACMGRRGNIVPVYEPATVVTVVERGENGIPVRFSSEACAR